MTTPAQKIRTRPILFSAPMVRALVAGAKTQTRRVVKPQPPDDKPRSDWFEPGVMGWASPEVPSLEWHRVRCPYGVVGDAVWVRETSRAIELPGGLDVVRYAADDAFRSIENTEDAADAWLRMHTYRGGKGLVVPAIHMPRWASRITLEITDVRVEKLQDISEADAIAEGIEPIANGEWKDYGDPMNYCLRPRTSYATLWSSINGIGAWDANPFVWVYSFRRFGC